MAKFHALIGYASEMTETAPGVYEPLITEKSCTGDLIRNTMSWETGEHLNDNVAIGNRFSFIADEYANQNIPYMKYIKWNGTKWEIKSVESLRPRLILTVGGVYNG